MVNLSWRLSRSGALTSTCSLVRVESALLSSFSLVIALSVVTSGRLTHGSSQKVIRTVLRTHSYIF